MRLTRGLLAAALCLIAAIPAWAQRYPMASGNTLYIPPDAMLIAGPRPNEEDKRLAQLLDDGLKLIQAKRQSEAIFMYFERVASVYNAQFTDKAIDYYCARTPVEQLLYLTQAVTSNRTTQIVPINWAAAHYLKGYALTELGRPGEARQAIERAVALSPHNSKILSELGHIDHVEKRWTPSLATFKRAEAAAREFSPDDVRKSELGRAMRGVAYSLVELKQYDEAEALYRKCLELDPADAAAQRKLRYVQNVRAKR